MTKVYVLSKQFLKNWPKIDKISKNLPKPILKLLYNKIKIFPRACYKNIPITHISYQTRLQIKDLLG